MTALILWYAVLALLYACGFAHLALFLFALSCLSGTLFAIAIVLDHLKAKCHARHS